MHFTAFVILHQVVLNTGFHTLVGDDNFLLTCLHQNFHYKLNSIEEFPGIAAADLKECFLFIYPDLQFVFLLKRFNSHVK